VDIVGTSTSAVVAAFILETSTRTPMSFAISTVAAQAF
jgi:hypothetical protein